MAPNQLHVPAAVAVALDQARARVAGALALGAVARERDEGSVEVHQLVQVDRAAAQVPGRVCREGCEQLQAAEAAELVAVGVHLGNANGNGLPRRGGSSVMMPFGQSGP